MPLHILNKSFSLYGPIGYRELPFQLLLFFLHESHYLVLLFRWIQMSIKVFKYLKEYVCTHVFTGIKQQHDAVCCLEQ